MRLLRYTAAFLVISLLWSALALYGSLHGWWMAAVVVPGDVDGFQQWAATKLHNENKGSSALALIEAGEVRHEFYSGPEIDRHTLFPTASFSKWMTALSVMSLVERGDVDLDAPISRYLSRWQLPDSDFDIAGVTARRLLSHTAGLTDRLGFGDYAATEALPTLEESLDHPRASSGETRIAVGIEPGTEFLYSGGGYLILQLLVEEVSGRAFADHVTRRILQPAGMQRSNYAYLGALDNATPSYHPDGSIAPSYRYASAAATGFNSNTADLSMLVRALLQGQPVSHATATAMREPHGFLMGTPMWGLGTILYAPTPAGDFVFGHDGGNDPAINSTVRVNPDTFDAIVVLVSGHPSLATQIASEWVIWQTGYPDLLSMERALRSAIGPIIIGVCVILLLVVSVARRKRRAK